MAGISISRPSGPSNVLILLARRIYLVALKHPTYHAFFACLVVLPYPTPLLLTFLFCTTPCTPRSIARPVRFAVPPRLPVSLFFSLPPLLLQLGGAILAEGASTAVLIGVVVSSNEATVFGGGLSFNDGSACLMTDSLVDGNTAGEGGGGLHFGGATGVMDGVTLSGNSVSAGRYICVVCRVCVCVCVCVFFFLVNVDHANRFTNENTSAISGAISGQPKTPSAFSSFLLGPREEGSAKVCVCVCVVLCSCLWCESAVACVGIFDRQRFLTRNECSKAICVIAKENKKTVQPRLTMCTSMPAWKKRKETHEKASRMHLSVCRVRVNAPGSV